MIRRFQFSLRALMGMVASFCLLPGSWKLLARYGQYIEATPVVVGEPIPIKGRLIRPLGPSELVCSVIIGEEFLDPLRTGVGFRARRSLFCCYEFEEEATGMQRLGSRTRCVWGFSSVEWQPIQRGPTRGSLIRRPTSHLPGRRREGPPPTLEQRRGQAATSSSNAGEARDPARLWR